MFTFQTSSRNHYFLVDPTCEKCPEGVCDRTSDGKCAIYHDGYHCLLGAAGVQCNYPGKCFDYGGKKFLSWIGSSADVDVDKCYAGNLS